MKNFIAVVALVALVSIGMVSADVAVGTGITPQISGDSFFAGCDTHMTHLDAYNAALNKYNGMNQVTAIIGEKTYRFGVFSDGWHFDAFTEMIP